MPTEKLSDANVEGKPRHNDLSGDLKTGVPKFPF